MNRSIYYNYIDDKLGALAYRITKRGKINLLDLNIYSETFFADMLNKLFGYNLKNINVIKQNMEAIDLIDEEKKIVAQVSATCTKEKVEKSLAKDIWKEYSSYRFIFISIAEDAAKLRTQTFKNPHYISFSPANDILDPKSISNSVLNLNIERMKDFYEFIKKELGEEPALDKVDSNLSVILKILSEEDLTDDIDTPEINSFAIDKKIEFNELSNIKEIIDEYKVYYSRLNDLYEEFDKQGANRSLSVLRTIKQYYIKQVSQGKKSVELFFSVVECVTEFVRNSRNCPDIGFEELEMCVYIVIVDAFIKCKIFKNPEGYSHVTARQYTTRKQHLL